MRRAMIQDTWTEVNGRKDERLRSCRAGRDFGGGGVEGREEEQPKTTGTTPCLPIFHRSSSQIINQSAKNQPQLLPHPEQPSSFLSSTRTYLTTSAPNDFPIPIPPNSQTLSVTVQSGSYSALFEATSGIREVRSVPGRRRPKTPGVSSIRSQISNLAVSCSLHAFIQRIVTCNHP